MQKDKESLREQLANLAHEQWSGWMDYLFSKCRETRPSDGEAFYKECLIIPRWAVDRWKKQAKTPYSELTPAEMDSDRTEADKFIAVLNPRIAELEERLDDYKTAMEDHCKNQCEGDARDACYSCQIYMIISKEAKKTGEKK